MATDKFFTDVLKDRIAFMQKNLVKECLTLQLKEMRSFETPLTLYLPVDTA